jgi:3-hydroxyacyl-CoA dehydrogenase
MRVDDIKTIGVLGGGVMGGGIAQVCALHGYKVIVNDLTDEVLQRTRSAIVDGRYGLRSAVERGKATQAQADAAIANLTFTTRQEDLRRVDLVIEAIPEQLELKKTVWAAMDDLVQRDAIFATNTSGFAISDLNKAVSRKDRFIGMHWFSPAPVMKLVEIVYAPETSEETIETMLALGERLEKVTIRVKDAPGRYGFVGNRVYFAAVAEARKIVEEGFATEVDVNKAMVYGFNWPVGPLAMATGARKGWD